MDTSAACGLPRSTSAKVADAKAAEAKVAEAGGPEDVAERERVVELIKAAVSERLTAVEMPSMKMAIKAASAEAKKALAQDSALSPFDKVELEKIAREAYKLGMRAKEEPPPPQVAMTNQVEPIQTPRAPDTAAQPPGGAAEDKDVPITTYVIAAEAAPMVSKLLGKLVSAGNPLSDELLAAFRIVLEVEEDMLDDELRSQLLADGFVERRLASQLVPASPGLSASVSAPLLLPRRRPPAATASTAAARSAAPAAKPAPAPTTTEAEAAKVTKEAGVAEQKTYSSTAKAEAEWAKAAEVASQIVSPSRSAEMKSASGTRTPEVVPFQVKTRSAAGSTRDRSGSSP
jgi:hypothetical protein